MSPGENRYDNTNNPYFKLKRMPPPGLECPGSVTGLDLPSNLFRYDNWFANTTEGLTSFITWVTFTRSIKH